MKENIIDRDKLQDALIESIIDGMDHKTMYAYVYDSLNGNFDDYSMKELIEETKEYYPELLEDSNVVHVTYTDTPMAEEVYGGWQTPWNPQRLINTMLFTVKDIQFDFDADDVTPEEMIDITDDTLGTWEACDEDDLIDEISTQTSWCIRSIDYVVQLS